ncbi:hypothetical protein E3E22_09815 [Thermococcus sp. MV5]|uniref:hypothetical protein n=1 Tax=Thermococcus sp. MV5 TaxID=1638272 RepID=UPI00143A222C|nr:hypothetical protein [Thermococcus sp. MV5]NJE26901.1 hypothetical protein [Thermococcus sp. MV5]
MNKKKLLMIPYSLFIFIVEAYLGIGNWKIVGLYMTTKRVGENPCVEFYCITPTWIFALAILILPLVIGYFLVERYEILREHAKSHLLFGLIVLPPSICTELSGGSELMILYGLALSTGLSFLLQRRHYEKQPFDLIPVVGTWFFIAYVLMIKPWVC